MLRVVSVSGMPSLARIAAAAECSRTSENMCRRRSRPSSRLAAMSRLSQSDRSCQTTPTPSLAALTGSDGGERDDLARPDVEVNAVQCANRSEADRQVADLDHGRRAMGADVSVRTASGGHSSVRQRSHTPHCALIGRVTSQTGPLGQLPVDLLAALIREQRISPAERTRAKEALIG